MQTRRRRTRTCIIVVKCFLDLEEVMWTSLRAVRNVIERYCVGVACIFAHVQKGARSHLLWGPWFASVRFPPRQGWRSSFFDSAPVECNDGDIGGGGPIKSYEQSVHSVLRSSTPTSKLLFRTNSLMFPSPPSFSTDGHWKSV